MPDSRQKFCAGSGSLTFQRDASTIRNGLPLGVAASTSPLLGSATTNGASPEARVLLSEPS